VGNNVTYCENVACDFGQQRLTSESAVCMEVTWLDFSLCSCWWL